MSNILLTMIIASLISLSVTGCAQPKTKDLYEVPNDRGGYAILDDDTPQGSMTELMELVRIQSIDRVELPYPRGGIPEYLVEDVSDIPSINVENALVVTPGEHKLLIKACQATVLPNLVGQSLMCATAVLRFSAEDGGRYRVRGNVSKGKDHADIWIEDLRTGHGIVSPIRIKGLEREYFYW